MTTEREDDPDLRQAAKTLIENLRENSLQPEDVKALKLAIGITQERKRVKLI